MEHKTHAVLAATETEAVSYAATRFKVPRSCVLTISQRADLYLLYGRQNLAFDVVPGTPFLGWHSELQSHVEYGRLKRVRVHVTK